MTARKAQGMIHDRYGAHGVTRRPVFGWCFFDVSYYFLVDVV